MVVIPKTAAEREISDAVKSNDDRGTQEAKQLGAGLSAKDLEKEALENEHERAESFKKHFERISLLALYAAAGALTIIGMALLFHMLTPSSCHWLKLDQISELKSIITGGALTGLVASHLRKRL